MTITPYLVLFPIQRKQHFIGYRISNGDASKGQRKGDRKRQSEWTSEMSIHTSRAGTCVSNSMLIHSMSNSRFRSKPATSSLFYIHNTYVLMLLSPSICNYVCPYAYMHTLIERLIGDIKYLYAKIHLTRL